MKREEEIVQQAIKEFPRFAERRVGFITGAKWSDEHLRKGLVDIEKVCEWLKRGGDFVNNTETMEDFRKAMEE